MFKKVQFNIYWVDITWKITENNTSVKIVDTFFKVEFSVLMIDTLINFRNFLMRLSLNWDSLIR